MCGAAEQCKSTSLVTVSKCICIWRKIESGCVTVPALYLSSAYHNVMSHIAVRYELLELCNSGARYEFRVMTALSPAGVYCCLLCPMIATVKPAAKVVNACQLSNSSMLQPPVHGKGSFLLPTRLKCTKASAETNSRNRTGVTLTA